MTYACRRLVNRQVAVCVCVVDKSYRLMDTRSMDNAIRTIPGMIAARLDNGVMIKASYRHFIGGTFIDLFVCDARGYLIGNRQFKFKGQVFDADDNARERVMTLARLLVKTKADTIAETRILQAVMPTLIDRAFPPISRKAA